ncbi:hypothetical protein INS49_002246 [Diaporthe citri]|uniref:uncharacterized protein n=1 Tax=Diaporthe citri TaxID=83186 RepID=UPI001C7FA879|nr:uncharacterized protein INS49_002246 [Diaporthe citri]KAG6368046.1 hypothetical protein INS49_002246 [Diaporthe citri]
MSSGPSQQGTFSLFPKDRPPSRTQNSTPGRPSIDSTPRDSQSRAGRRTPLERNMSVRDGKKTSATAHTGPSVGASEPYPIIQRPAAVVTAEPPARCGTAFSEAQTLVRANSDRSRNSIAKPPLDNRATQYGEGSSEAPLRSIFPEYNPNLPLSQQNYYPPQSSPTHPANIPAGAISRRLYSPTSEERPENPEDTTSPLRSPMSANSSRTHQQTATRKWPPPRVNVANGWKAPASEGRVYTFTVSSERDTPIYTLASKSSQPFYRLKLDPTSASAYVSLSRFDPSKPYKPPVPPKDGGSSGSPRGGSSESVGGEPSTKGWQEVLSTTLEEAARHHAPHDGLVALLYPLPAAKLAVDSRYTNPAAFATAERECARLVWDDDSGNHFLVHPALAMPFCVTVERNPAWSRTEYTLEHVESPQHLARLTRDGTGTGWLEVDTGIAAKIDAVYLVDVAVAALMLVAHADGEFSRVEVFDPPPPSLRSESRQGQGEQGQQGGRASRLSRMTPRVNSGDKKEKKSGRARMEEFELDLESQTSDLKKHSKRRSKDEDKMPGCARAIISLLGVIFKCLIWCATVLFKALTGCISLFARCITSEKL